MLHPIRFVGRLLVVWAVLAILTGFARAADLATASPEELLRVYAQLRQLRAGDQWAIAENIAWKRDSATFTFIDGRIVFAAPVEGHVVAAAFEGRGTFELNPPTPIDQQQISRFTKAPRLQDQFRQAVFFFTDDSWAELQKLLAVRSGGAPVSDAFAAAQKKCVESFNDWWANETKGNFPMRNLAARMLADLADPSSRGFFLADFKADDAGDLMFQISWNRDPLLLPGIGNDEEVMLLHYNRGNYFEWWSGFHLAAEYARSPHPEHRKLLATCRREMIDAEVTKDNHLQATADLEYEVMDGSPRLLPLQLRGVLRISSVQDGGGKALQYIQEPRELDNDPWVILPAPGKPGQPSRMKIAYAEDSTRDSRIIHQRGSGLYYVTARESWFPSFGAFDDRTNFQLHFQSPKKFTFVGTGRRLKAAKGKDFLETEWESEIPYGVVGFNYGDFVDKSQSDAGLTVTAYTGKEIPDELKGLQSAIDMAELATGSGGNRNLAGQLGIATGGFSTRTMVGYAAGVSYQALKLYEYYFGKLPFKNVSVTEQPVRGYGQSWPTLIFLPYDSLLDSTTRHGLRLQESADAREFYQIVAVHEMAHQWWGHLVGWKTYHDQWLSEGIAEFSAGLYLAKTEPKQVRAFWDLKRDRLVQKNPAGHRPVDVGPLWLAFQLPTYLEPELYQRLVYFKGAYVLEMLRTMMENPRDKAPDGRFINMMRDFVSTYAGKNASTEDFRRVVEKHMGEPMDWFFNQWVYGTEIPSFAFNYQLREEGGKTILSGALTQSGVSSNFQSRVPFYVYVNGQPRRLGLITVRGSNTATGDIPLGFKPEKVTLDETHSILCVDR
jgi:hypothetical protein